MNPSLSGDFCWFNLFFRLNQIEIRTLLLIETSNERMGFLTTVLMVTLPATSYTTFLAFRLGNQLPIACRNFGRNIGMGYNYFKVVLRLLAPETEKPAEIFDLIRKSE